MINQINNNVPTVYLLHDGQTVYVTLEGDGSIQKVTNQLIRDEESGKLAYGTKTIGLMKKAVSVMTEIFINDLPNIDPENVFITHTPGSDASYNEIVARFNQCGVFDQVKNVHHTVAGCVIGSHCGPGTIGILYIMKDELNDEEFDDDKL